MTSAARLRITLVLAAGTAIAWGTSSCNRETAPQPKVIVIGFDGMDPRRCERMMDAGDLPNLARLRDQGGYRPLGTSIPPQSPVAWSNFITGAGPGVHGIFDFIHRDPSKQCRPFYAAAETVQGDDGWDVGDHQIPLTFWPFNHDPTRTLLRRHGTPFWDYLDEAGVSTRIYDIPSNYPPSPSQHGHVCCLSGMGVPDLLGGYGTYQYFSEDTPRNIDEGGGMRKRLAFVGDRANAVLVGPQNTVLKKPVRSEIEFQIHRHPSDPTARIELQDQTIVLKEGEWSDWCKVEYDIVMPSFLPNDDISGICRFYLQEVRPNFRLYVTPINIDPSDPGEQLIAEPPGFVTDISDELGLFYTAGFQEDHKALTNGIFADNEFREQARYVLKERKNLLRYAFDHYEDGLLFFYFSSTDVQAHMLWWDGDAPHPVRSPEEARRNDAVVDDIYRDMDGIVGEVVEQYGDEATILIMSDHGFCNFRRQFNINSWLRDNGYIQPRYAKDLLSSVKSRSVDWERTRAYGLGLNGLYINLKGRERDGIVSSADRDGLLDEIAEKLLAVRDPSNGEQVIAKVYRSDQVYTGPYTATAPDLILGYNRGYRVSWDSVLGKISKETITDNDSAWSADHCIAAEQIPGVIFSNRRILRGAPSLVDMAPTILEQFSVPVPESMTGRSLFRSDASASADDSHKE